MKSRKPAQVQNRLKLNQRVIIGVFSAFTYVEDGLTFSSQPGALFSNSLFLENMDGGAASKARGPTRGSGCLGRLAPTPILRMGENSLKTKR